ncbi:MAG: DUF2214 family protein [Flavobacteriales bacterium]|nr:DUF2214 family protein [Flavobacteriales bacterium]MCB9167557.1 DUF2214 family protein [Flavobacteriales bacterium]
MFLRLTLAIAHLLALAIGLGAVWGRWRALRKLRDITGLDAVFHADNWYGVAALLWIVTGLWRAFGGVEKGTDHYLSSHTFLTKMGLFVVVLLLELRPMVTFIRWRSQMKRGRTPDLTTAPLLARLTIYELPLLVLMVAMAATMARGW